MMLRIVAGLTSSPDDFASVRDPTGWPSAMYCAISERSRLRERASREWAWPECMPAQHTQAPGADKGRRPATSIPARTENVVRLVGTDVAPAEVIFVDGTPQMDDAAERARIVVHVHRGQ